MLETLLIGFIIFSSNAIQAITGFGSSAIAIPFITFIIGIKSSVMLMTFCSLVLSSYILIRDFKYINFKKALFMLMIMIPSLPLGMYVFKNIDPALFKKLLGIFLVLIASLNIIKSSRSKEDEKRISLPLSISTLLLSGLVQGAISSGGPILVIYASKEFKEKRAFRATLALIWVTLNTIIFSSYFYFSRINSTFIDIAIYQIPFLILGIIAGNIIHKKINEKTFLYFVFSILLVVGTFMIIS